MKTILVTGGAGYIGSHAVYALAEKGYNVIIIDNLEHGYMQCIDELSKKFKGKIKFYKKDLRRLKDIETVFRGNKIHAVMHFAALCSVNESAEDPHMYYVNNVVGSLNLLETMLKYKVMNMIFSSTCATYGESMYLPIDENHEQHPIISYGTSKYMVELILEDFNESYGLNYIIFRYFNVCGAQKDGIVGDSKRPSVLLMQNAVRGALDIEPFYFTCPKVDTPDGTTIRDYIDVNDLVNAHIMGMEYLKKTKKSDIFNLGSGKGSSTKSIVDKVEEVTGKKFERKTGQIRKGDAAVVYASAKKAKKILGWKTENTLEDSVKSLIKWYTLRPNGWEY